VKKKPTTPTIEWQVIHGDGQTIHVFPDEQLVVEHLRSEHQRFSEAWMMGDVERLSLTVRKVVRWTR